MPTILPRIDGGLRKVYALGHSFGGRRDCTPELDRTISRPPGWVALDGTISMGGYRSLPLYITNTLGRRTHWPSQAAAHEVLAAHPFFGSWDKDVLDVYVKQALVESEEGGEVRLECDKEDEAAVYAKKRASWEAWGVLPRVDERVALLWINPPAGDSVVQTRTSKGFGFAEFNTLETARAFVDPNFPFVHLPPPQSHGASATKLFWQMLEQNPQAPMGGRRMKIDFSQSANPGERGGGGNAKKGPGNDGTRDIGNAAAPVLLFRGLDVLSGPQAILQAMKTSSGLHREGAKGMKKIVLVKDRVSMQSWGFAFVEFVDTQKNLADAVLCEAAHKKVAAMNGGTKSEEKKEEERKYRNRASERRVIYGQPDVPLPEPSSSRQTGGPKFAPAQALPTPPPTINPGEDSSNIGNKLLKAMGWKEGTGLGVEGNEGRTAPVQAAVYASGAGLGAAKGRLVEDEVKRKEGYAGYVERVRDAARDWLMDGSK
ncbi:unnamed protein product [Peniophora sp. CBMAI 1063]|nr:unnamed protein product [Peniophora sp. CBMAI 1063]